MPKAISSLTSASGAVAALKISLSFSPMCFPCNFEQLAGSTMTCCDRRGARLMPPTTLHRRKLLDDILTYDKSSFSAELASWTWPAQRLVQQQAKGGAPSSQDLCHVAQMDARPA